MIDLVATKNLTIAGPSILASGHKGKPARDTSGISRASHLIPHIVHPRIIIRSKFLQRAGMENLKDRLARAVEEIEYIRQELRKEEERGEEYATTGKYANVQNRTSIL